MATRNSSGVERRRDRRDGNRPRTHPIRSGRKASKPDRVAVDACDCLYGDPDVLLRLSRAISLVETIAVAMQAFEADIKLGSIAASLDSACCQLWRAHGAVDLALNQVAA